jgi:hypothetical protein
MYPANSRPEDGDPEDRRISGSTKPAEGSCDSLYQGGMTHDNGKDYFRARSGEYLRGGRAGDARMGPAGAPEPGRGRAAGRDPQADRDHVGHRAAQTPRSVPRNKPTGPSWGVRGTLPPDSIAARRVGGT